MGLANTIQKLRKRSSQEHVPRMIRKIWLARDLYDATEAGSEQHVAFCDKEVCVLHGREFLYTRLHPSLPPIKGEIRAINLIRRVWFDVPFQVLPSIFLEPSEPSSACRLRAVDISCAGFDIVAEFQKSHHADEKIVALWKAVGFSVMIPEAEFVAT